MHCGVHGRIADGIRGARTVGAHRRLFHGRPRTGRAGGVFPGLTRGAESGVHPYVPAGALRGFPGRGAGTGKADALTTKALRESGTMAAHTSRPTQAAVRYVPALSTPARLRSSPQDAVAVCYQFVT